MNFEFVDRTWELRDDGSGKFRNELKRSGSFTKTELCLVCALSSWYGVYEVKDIV